MFNSFSLAVLVPIFLLGALVVWIAGIHLANTTATLSSRFHFGEALGGIIFLAISTNLPEMAITSSAAVTHHLGLAIGNILGGIAVQTLVLVGLDWFGFKESGPADLSGCLPRTRPRMCDSDRSACHCNHGQPPPELTDVCPSHAQQLLNHRDLVDWRLASQEGTF